MGKSAQVKTNWTLGEISPRAFGRFDPEKPIFKNGAAIIENWLVYQSGAAIYRPATRYVAEIKVSANSVRLERFTYSTTQEYIMELGNLYMRFYANSGQLTSGGIPVEIVTVFAQADLNQLQMANKADVMYIVHNNYFPQKLIRTSATTFTITDAPIVRGPFRDTNVTTTTITPSSDTGATTLTASTAIFQNGHIGSLWRVKSGVVKISAYTSPTVVSGTVQAEPSGTAGNLATGPGAVTDWAEGAFSTYRGFPAAVTFHEQRVIYGGTVSEPQKIWSSQIGAYDNFDAGTAKDNEAYTFEISSNVVNDIRWLNTDTNLKIGTSGGTITAQNVSGQGMNAANPPNIILDTDYAVMKIQPTRIASSLFYIQANTFNLRQLVFDFVTNRDEAEDMNLLADHILRDGGGAVQIAKQQSPNDRLWVVRGDGQLAVFTRNSKQQILAWCRFVSGTTAAGYGQFESIAVLPMEGQDDQIWVVVKRNVNGSTKRYVEYFTPEIFGNYWDPVRLDCSLTFDNPITITGFTNANPGVVTAAAHGFSNGDQVKIDSIVAKLTNSSTGEITFGQSELNTNSYLVANKTANTFELNDLTGNPLDTSTYGTYISGGQVRKMATIFTGLSHLNGETISVQTDGGLPAGTQTYTVSGGSITLVAPAAVVHAGLPYKGTIKLLPFGQGGQQTNHIKVYNSKIRVWKSNGGKFGDSLSNLFPLVFETTSASPLYTGDIPLDFESFSSEYFSPYFVQDQPLPFMLLAGVFSCEINEEK